MIFPLLQNDNELSFLNSLPSPPVTVDLRFVNYRIVLFYSFNQEGDNVKTLNNLV